MSECDLFWVGGTLFWEGGGEWGCMGNYFGYVGVSGANWGIILGGWICWVGGGEWELSRGGCSV